MHILNLSTKEITTNIEEVKLNEDYHFIICNPWELKFFKDTLKLDNEAYKNCLSYHDKVTVNMLDDYIFFTFFNFQIDDEDILLEEINIFLSEKYILVVLRKKNDMYNEVKQLMRDNFFYKSNLTLSLFTIYSNILRIMISNQFENLERVEEKILKIEDDIINETDNDMSTKISKIRSICRSCVKSVRPLTYMMDTLLKDGMEFFSKEKTKNSHLEREYEKLLQGLDLSVDKLYSFSLSTRELADKLLDIYSSKVSEKTNNLITKLTILTGAAVPISIITGIYGMNFKYMPELSYIYGYRITMLVILLIIFISFVVFKRKKFL